MKKTKIALLSGKSNKKLYEKNLLKELDDVNLRLKLEYAKLREILWDNNELLKELRERYPE